jgi:signal transduction histidine kinase
VLAELAHARKREEPFISEYRMMTSDGGMVWLRDEAVIVHDTTGRPLCLQGVMFNITERKQAEEELKQSRQQLRDLASHLQSVREEERTHIAREIHDDLGQALTALKLDTHWLASRLTDDQVLLLEKTKSMSSLIDITVKSVQRISSELRPGLLDDLGLSAAIEWQADEFENRTSIKCNIATDPEEIVLDRDRSTAIYRIFQEALTNVARHANATVVDISLKQKSDAIELKVTDDGKGITEEQISDPSSFGLIGIHERVYSMGGTLEISGVSDRGTRVIVSVPLDNDGKSI